MLQHAVRRAQQQKKRSSNSIPFCCIFSTNFRQNCVHVEMTQHTVFDKPFKMRLHRELASQIQHPLNPKHIHAPSLQYFCSACGTCLGPYVVACSSHENKRDSERLQAGAARETAPAVVAWRYPCCRPGTYSSQVYQTASTCKYRSDCGEIRVRMI